MIRPVHFKVCIAIVLFVFLNAPIKAQVAISTDNSNPNPNAMLDIKSNSKGILIPRVDSDARKAIPNTKGLLVYDTTFNSFWYNTGEKWQNLANAQVWSFNGNNDITDDNFIGPLNNAPFNVKVKNTLSGRIDPKLFNSYWGFNAGSITTSGVNNTAVGYQSLNANAQGNNNAAYGALALANNTVGSNNVAIGHATLFHNLEGKHLVAVGDSALFNQSIDSKNVYGNTAIGSKALFTNTTGYLNTSTGFQSLISNTIGNNNTANGSQCLFANTEGNGNVAVGTSSLFLNATGSNNTANGYLTLVSNISGNNNTVNGALSLLLNSNGNNNTSAGFQSLLSNSSGNDNVAVGASSLLSNTTGNQNVAIGTNADVLSGELNNATSIGYGAIVDASNKVRIGNSGVTVIEGQVPFTTPSDGRFKFNIREDVQGLKFILRLRPITYQFDTKRFDGQLNLGKGQYATWNSDNLMNAAYDKSALIRRSGFIAQEVEKAADASNYNFNGVVKPETEKEYYSLSYESFVVPLVKAVQEQQQMIMALKEEVKTLRQVLEMERKPLHR